MDYLRLIRWKNLIIIASVQWIVHFTIVLPALEADSSKPVLDLPQFFLLVLSTICIAASGYIINDMYDAGIDRLNRPDTVLIPDRVSRKRAFILYLALIIVGAMLTIYLAFSIEKPALSILYPISALALWLYSVSLKGMILVGNFLVSAFCSGVVLLPLLAEWASGLPAYYLQAAFIYAIFAGLITFFRELVKDLEDVEGDAAGGAKTLAVVMGRKRSVKIAFFTGLVLLLTLLYWVYALVPGKGTLLLILGIVFISLWLSLLLLRLLRALQRRDFRWLSTQTKYLMLAGTVLLFFL